MLPEKGLSEQSEREKFIATLVKIACIGIIAIVLFFGSFYTLPENQVAVLLTFGKPEAVTTAGMHFKIPFVQKIYKFSSEIIGMPIGYSEEFQDASIADESEMITKDFNFVNADFYVEYRVIDPVQVYINRDTAESILKNLALSYIRDTIGVYDVDEVITTGKVQIQNEIEEKLTSRIEQENIGLAVVNVMIQDAEPPADTEVQQAFKEVEEANQNKSTMINKGNEYNSTNIPTANAEADKVVQDAEAYRQEKISDAEGQAERFNELYNEYIKYPYITKKRMFYETLEDVLPDLKVIINNSDGTSTMLPLDSFVQNNTATE